MPRAWEVSCIGVGFGMGCAPQLAALSAPFCSLPRPPYVGVMNIHELCGSIQGCERSPGPARWIPVLPGCPIPRHGRDPTAPAPMPQLDPFPAPSASHSRHPGPFPKAGTAAPSQTRSCCSSAPLSICNFGSSSCSLPSLPALQPRGPSAGWQIPGRRMGNSGGEKEPIPSKMEFIHLQPEA